MNEADISQALGQHLASMTDVPSIVWENKDSTAGKAKPYLVVQNVRTGRTDDTLDGVAPISRGYLMVTVVEEKNKFATPAEVLADSIAAWFPQGTELPITGAMVTITTPSNVKPGFSDDINWRIPVRINYSAS